MACWVSATRGGGGHCLSYYDSLYYFCTTCFTRHCIGYSVGRIASLNQRTSSFFIKRVFPFFFVNTAGIIDFLRFNLSSTLTLQDAKAPCRGTCNFPAELQQFAEANTRRQVQYRIGLLPCLLFPITCLSYFGFFSLFVLV